MSGVKGKLRKLLKYSGELTQQTPDIKAEITSIDAGPQGTMSRVPGIAGAWSRAGRWITGTTTRLYVLYRFLTSRRVVQLVLKAKASTAPAVEVNADSAIQTAVDAPGKAQPAKVATVDSKVYVSVMARAAAYIRVPLTYIKGIAMSHFARPVAAPGAIGRYIKAVMLGRVSKAEAAPGAIAESRNNVQNVGLVADADTAPGVTAPAFEEVLNVGLTASADAAKGQSLTVESVIAVACYAAPYCWCLPEITDDTLAIYQVFSGIQSGDTLEIDMEDESAYWANATVDGDTLNLVFVASATQTDDELELM